MSTGNKEKQSMNTARHSGRFGWFDINWAQANAQVKLLQIEIAVAFKEGNVTKVTEQQNRQVESFARKALAVYTVTTNKGKQTPGVDGIVWDNPARKMEAVKMLCPDNSYVAKPVKRVYIPKRSGKLRPLGIPTMYDRAMQTQWNMAQVPIAECTRDQHSYGFRKHRSTADCRRFLWLQCSKKHHPNWVQEADIKGFFDNIHHQWIMDNIPMNKHILKQFLKAGFLEKNQFHSSESGVPQGGSISPTIANMTLDGLTDVVKEAGRKVKRHAIKSGRARRPWVHLIRYADDFVVTALSKRMLEGPITNRINEFLAERGLQLNTEKTCITHQKKGFDFVGFNFKLFPFAKAKSGSGFMFLMHPTKANIKKVKAKVKRIVQAHKHLSATLQIKKLNPVLMGWANYYRSINRTKTFKLVNHYVWCTLWKWCRVKHLKASHKELAKQYFTSIGKRKWIFYGMEGTKRKYLFQLTDVKIVRHVLVKHKNPFLPEDQEYFAKKGSRFARQQVWGWTKYTVRKKSGFKCKVCDQLLLPDQPVEIHHVQPKKLGGSDAYKNLVRLHKECHKQVTHTKNTILLAQFKEKGILQGSALY